MHVYGDQIVNVSTVSCNDFSSGDICVTHNIPGSSVELSTLIAWISSTIQIRELQSWKNV